LLFSKWINLSRYAPVSNLELAQFIANTAGRELNYEMVNHHATRPGHDLRYGLSGDKMAKMGWIPPLGFEDSLRNCIKWTMANTHWLNLKKWADDPNDYEGISPQSIGTDEKMERAAKL
jgi:UDP-glucose 4,6-dehydratase